MKIQIRSLKRFLPLWLAALASTLTLQAATMQNAGFGAKTGWSGTFLAGTNGGDGWTTSYFAGGVHPTDNTFACKFQSAVKQNLGGTGNTFVAGVSYTVTAQLFSAGGYVPNTKIMWDLGLTADGTPVAIDHWFSDEFSANSVANGGTIPNDHILTVSSSSNGLTTATVTFTATAAEAGKVIGIQLNGDAQTKYAGVTVAGPDDWYAMVDNVTFDANLATIGSFTSDIQVLDGAGFYLTWSINKPELINTLTLDSGSGPLDVLPDTELGTGEGFIFVEPTAETTYTLLLNGTQQSQLIVYAGKTLSLTRSARLATAPSYEVTLDWSVQPANASVSLSDGVTTIDVTADTDPETGLGSKTVVVPSPSTIYTLKANDSPLAATTRVLRETGSSAALSISASSVVTGQPVTITWTGAAGGATDWIGIYSTGKTPGFGGELSNAWNYLSGTRTPEAGHTDGTMSFTLPAGDYYVALFLNDGYEIAQGPITFSVVDPPPVEETIKVASITKDGNSVTLVWESKADMAYSIYGSDTLQGDPLTDWDEVSIELPSDGDDTTDFTETFGSGAPARRFYRIYEVVPSAP